MPLIAAATAGVRGPMLIPKARGAFSEALFAGMRRWPDEQLVGPTSPPEDEEDAAIALWALYELHYGGFDDTHDDLEWHPVLLRTRHALETALEGRLTDRWEGHVPDGPFVDAFFDYVGDHDGPSIARHVHKEADVQQLLDLLRFRSVYHLKEADPTVWTVPRLPTAAKAPLVEVLYDEFGAGIPRRLHAELFARGLDACGLRPEYGAYVDEAPAEILEQNNAMSLFGLHRRLRGASVGHFAAFEVGSPVPSRQMAQGLDRVGLAPEMVHYYAEHAEADAVHEQLAVRDVCGGLLAAEPALAAQVWFGAFTCLDQEARVAKRLLAHWGVAA